MAELKSPRQAEFTPSADRVSVGWAAVALAAFAVCAFVVLSESPQDLRIYDAEGEPGVQTWSYGGTTAVEQVDSDDGAVVVARLDRSSWSGVMIDRPANALLDLTDIRTTGALVFWARSPSGYRQVSVGLVDDQGQGLRVRTQLWFFEWQDLTTEWQRFEIPLARLADDGAGFNEKTGVKGTQPFRWDRVRGVALSVSRPGVLEQTAPVEVYIKRIGLITATDWESPALRWSRFHSSAPDRTIYAPGDDIGGWRTQRPDGSPHGRLEVQRDAQGRPRGLGMQCPVGRHDRCSFGRVFGETDAHADWSHHAGLRLLLAADGLWPHVHVTLTDSDGEIWQTLVEVAEGRSQVVPFSRFSKVGVRPRMRPTGVRENNYLDTSAIRRLDLGLHAVEDDSLEVRFVGLTNAAPGPADESQGRVPETVLAGQLSAVGRPIEEGALGINAGVWDSDLLAPETVARVGRVGHVTVRYPGGLTADTHHWEQELAAQDPHRVDTDEFLAWCEQVGVTPVFTVNMGNGTPAEAARWVAHTEGRVRYWELGNELYGPWHPHQMTPADYARRASVYIDAMKAVDPAIKIGILGDWDRTHEPWNSVVLDVVGHKADAVIAHSYQIGPGQDIPDRWVQSSPASSAFPTMRRFQRELAPYARSGRPMPIWLTEWSLVADSPDKRSLTMEQALYVATMLGGLAENGDIQLAHYWTLHNDVTPSGGDYGYLARSYDPAGGHRPRPAYFAFRMAADVLRGRLLPVTVGREEIAAYLTRQSDGQASLLLLNRHETQSIRVMNQVTGLTGPALIETLVEESGIAGPAESRSRLSFGDHIILPPASVTRLAIAIAPHEAARPDGSPAPSTSAARERYP